MGIPSYFSYIIKNHPRIIRQLRFFANQEPFHSLFMDCNSIIYDAVRTIEESGAAISSDDFETRLIEEVICKIDEYIRIIHPSNTIFIAFDGVAPFAKMEQQRTRRYKTYFLASLEGGGEAAAKWNTSAITPGTPFMTKLSTSIEFAFQKTESKYAVQHIIVSPSTQIGEGEHKLFAYLRQHPDTTANIAVYGLDADLLMLSIFHLPYSRNIYVFREAPAFIQNMIPLELRSKNEKQPYFLDIRHLADSISTEMACPYPDPQRIIDYVFICFFLGNDFLPHFPAMNIRTHGIHALLDIYREFIGNEAEQFLISKATGHILWKNVKRFVAEIAKREHDFLLKEYDVRDKFERRVYPETNDEERAEVLNHVPVLYRAEEKYIAPKEFGWEARYYKVLFSGMRRTDEHVLRNIANNYLEGLEWVYRYYTEGCADWRWTYKESYPPLFIDLVKYIPLLETQYIAPNENLPFSPEEQLSYVLPTENMKYDFQWSFCRYFWESHLVAAEGRHII
jgi:5'-3' exonuclease